VSTPQDAPEVTNGAPDAGAETPRASYLATSRNLVASFVLVAPLWAGYQVGILTTDGWRNGVDFITPRLYALSGSNTGVYFAINLAILVAMLAAAGLMSAGRKPTFVTWGLVVLESTLYACVMGFAISELLLAMGLEPPGLSMSTLDSFVLSLGAGAYEELVFRLGLLGGMIWLGKRLGFSGLRLYLVAFLLSSAIFSGFHYVPVGDDPWQVWSFTFRFFAGMVFAALYLGRGFAVAVYTHAIYDVIVLVF